MNFVNIYLFSRKYINFTKKYNNYLNMYGQRPCVWSCCLCMKFYFLCNLNISRYYIDVLTEHGLILEYVPTEPIPNIRLYDRSRTKIDERKPPKLGNI